MKKILLFLLPVMLFISCEKQYLIPADEVPSWLKNRIADIEKEIRSDSRYEMSAWFRYSYSGEYYFEWFNLISSSFPPVYNYDGEIMTFSSELYLQYESEKCCKTTVWKGPQYPDGL
jgi:hypothetical protein